MAVGDQDSGPPAVVKVVELHSPSQPRFDLAQAGGVCDVIKVIAAAIQVERRSVITEIGFDDVLIAAVRKIVCGKAHSSLLGPVLVVRHSRLSPNIAERSVMVVVIQNTGGTVSSHVNIWPPVIVESRPQ